MTSAAPDSATPPNAVPERPHIPEREFYRETDESLRVLEAARAHAKELEFAFNSTLPTQSERRAATLHELVGTIGDGTWIEQPLRVAYGYNLHLGSDVYANVGLTVVDDGEVFVGDRVMFAPNVTITTTGHPVHPELREGGGQFTAAVHIEDDVWIGAGAIVLPGVRIGHGSVIGAGSVVTSHIPPMVVAAGSPARILRPITDADKTWTYREPNDAR